MTLSDTIGSAVPIGLRLRRKEFGRAAIAVASLLSIAAPLEAQSFSVDRLTNDTKILSSDEFEGRAPLTIGQDKALAYIVNAMKEIGLKPSVGESYLQPVPMVRTQTLTDPAPRFTVTGPSGSASFAYKSEVALNVGEAASNVNIVGSDVVFVGYGINAPEKHWNDYAGVDVRGKTVLILINDPDWQNPTTEGPFGGKAMTYYGRYVYKFEEAARQGAAAAIVIHSDAAAGYPFSVPATSLAAATTALDLPDHRGNSLKVRSWITHAAAEKLMHLANQNLDELEKAAAVRGFTARPLDLHAAFSFKVQLTRGISDNVIGVLPGRTHPDEYVIYTAHWDHLGRCPADKTGDDICNGAIDNASGVAGLLELARVFKRNPPPDRSIMFLSTTGEEQGFLGSQYYVTHPTRALAKTVADIDMDPLNFMFGETRDVPLIADQTDLAAVAREVAASEHRIVTADSSPEQGYRYRSDTLSFARAGVPIVLVGVGLDVIGKPKGWGQQALDRYNRLHYHQPSDSYDPNWDWSGAVLDLEFFHDVGWRLANSRNWPNWFPNDEFRAVRDAVLKAAKN